MSLVYFTRHPDVVIDPDVPAELEIDRADQKWYFWWYENQDIYNTIKRGT